MLLFVVRWVVWTIPILFVVLTLTFFLLSSIMARLAADERLGRRLAPQVLFVGSLSLPVVVGITVVLKPAPARDRL